MKARLKEEILREADKYGNGILVIHETDEGEIFDAWEHITSDLIQSPLKFLKAWKLMDFPLSMLVCPLLMEKLPKVLTLIQLLLILLMLQKTLPLFSVVRWIEAGQPLALL
ncbi:hypothetical protein QN277_019704 [Acacia crassicarpa]|uniref:Uncharacterized protein n=1 Tax=Acacia crassicarpa TaxID=499986 RepID=A0AAE1MNL0_9FABA|nr:hypothetical protein QN277_019704 [Acacia crassicarpa]